jgi:hypothetical protein
MGLNCGMLSGSDFITGSGVTSGTGLVSGSGVLAVFIWNSSSGEVNSESGDGKSSFGASGTLASDGCVDFCISSKEGKFSEPFAEVCAPEVLSGEFFIISNNSG